MKMFFAMVLMLFTHVTHALEEFDVLSWVAPTTREDTLPYPLEEQAGYRIYGVPYNSDSTEMQFLVDIPEPSTLTYTFVYDLPYAKDPYTSQYAITAYDIWDNESALSEVVSKSFLSSPSAVPSSPSGVTVQ